MYQVLSNSEYNDTQGLGFEPDIANLRPIQIGYVQPINFSVIGVVQIYQSAFWALLCSGHIGKFRLYTDTHKWLTDYPEQKQLVGMHNLDYRYPCMTIYCQQRVIEYLNEFSDCI